MAEPNGKDEGSRKASGSGASPDGSSKSSTSKMRTKKLTVDPNLTPAVTEPKPNFALYAAGPLAARSRPGSSNAGTFSEEDVKISQKVRARRAH